MNLRWTGWAPRLWGLGLAMMVLLIAPRIVAATEQLLIRQIGGGVFTYNLSDIDRITFQGDEMLLDAGGIDVYPLPTIQRMEFLQDPSLADALSPPEDLLRVVQLFQNRPNPFGGETGIEFLLSRPAHVRMMVCSVSGRVVRRLVNADLAAGRHVVRWDGLDDEGRRMPGGIYFCRLAGGGAQESRRMLLLH